MMRSVLLAWLVCVGTWVLIAFVDVESVLVAGPIILLLGILLVVLGYLRQYRWAFRLGVAHIAVTWLFFGLVNLLEWSPRQAVLPFTIIGLAYLAFVTPLTWLAWRQRPPVFEPWQCQACGYPLFGLAHPNCPECGRPFDLESVRRLQPPDSHPSLGRRA